MLEKKKLGKKTTKNTGVTWLYQEITGQRLTRCDILKDGGN